MNYEDFNKERLKEAGPRVWDEAVKELRPYIRWRLKGKTRYGAHSEKALLVPAEQYYEVEAVIALLEGRWKWQERYTLAEQLKEIAGNLMTKQVERYKREHPSAKVIGDGLSVIEDSADADLSDDNLSRIRELENCGGFRKKAEFIEYRGDMEIYGDVMEDDEQERLDETYERVLKMVQDDVELTRYVEGMRMTAHLRDMPEVTGFTIEMCYRLQEKLVRRVRRVSSSKIQVSRANGLTGPRCTNLTNGTSENDIEGKKRMRFIDKVMLFEEERLETLPEETERRERLLAFIRERMKKQDESGKDFKKQGGEQ